MDEAVGAFLTYSAVDLSKLSRKAAEIEMLDRQINGFVPIYNRDGIWIFERLAPVLIAENSEPGGGDSGN